MFSTRKGTEWPKDRNLNKMWLVKLGYGVLALSLHRKLLDWFSHWTDSVVWRIEDYLFYYGTSGELGHLVEFRTTKCRLSVRFFEPNAILSNINSPKLIWPSVKRPNPKWRKTIRSKLRLAECQLAKSCLAENAIGWMPFGRMPNDLTRFQMIEDCMYGQYVLMPRLLWFNFNRFSSKYSRIGW